MKKIFFLLFVLFLTSCSPRLHINGFFVRNYNFSQNKYGVKNPYIGRPERQRMYSSWGRFWFFRW